MPLPAIPHLVAGFMGMNQTTWGTAGTLTAATDGMYPHLEGLPSDPFPFSYAYEDNGRRDVKTGRPIKRTAPAGRNVEGFNFNALFKGAGTAYTSSSVLPPNEVHLNLQWSGFDATFSTDKWLYTLTPVDLTYKFGTFGYYAMAKSHLLRDVLNDWSFTAEGLALPVHTFAMRGIPSAARASLSLPAITYPRESVDPPVSKSGTFVIGDFITPITKSHGFSLNRQFGPPRLRQQETDGHMGWVPIGVDPVMMMTVEQTALVGSPYHTNAGLDPDALREAATGITVSTRMGSTTNRWGVSMTNAQCVKAEPSSEDGIATVNLEFKMTASTTVTVTLD